MIKEESDQQPPEASFDAAIVAVGFESRCRWVFRKHKVVASKGLGLEFGFAAEGAYADNRAFFEQRSFRFINGLANATPAEISQHIAQAPASGAIKSVFIDISSMSRQMIANAALGIHAASLQSDLIVTAAYAPSRFARSLGQAPIRVASPIKPNLAGWSSMPEKPLAAIFGLGAEEGLALGALQVLEPDKAWAFMPRGVDQRYDRAMTEANAHISDIFEVSCFDYDIVRPTGTRARVEALLNSIDGYFRVVCIPFGPKIFSWLSLATVIFEERSEVGVWAFSSKEHTKVFDRRAEGTVIWHTMKLGKKVEATEV